MSKTVDERVVSMQFDNKHFETNVQTSLSTIDKLKRALKLDDAAKGLDSVSKSAKNFDISGMGNGIDAVKAKFSALDIMAGTVLANITNTAVNAGRKFVSAFTFEPITSGLEEYETQINSVQTILSNTRSDGTSLKQVNDALDELNTYADKTIYNFTEMTRNIGTFTAAGVKLDTSVSAIKGIANLAAVSGSNSQQASTAMYQLSQALAAGTVKLQDWNSVVNAGMGGKVFQDALKETARVHGIAIDQMEKDEGSFRETLQNGWLSSEILTETLSKFTGDLTEQQILSMGYTKEQAKEIMALGQDANDAATKVKTFTQLLDTLKEAAQSGWTQTWEILIGDFEEAKSLWTGVSNFFGGIIDRMSRTRNIILEQAMGNPLVQLGKKISGFTKTATDAVNKVQDLGKIVDKVINGDLGNSQKRFDELTKRGYDWAKVQNEINKKLGDSTRYAEQKSDATKKLTKSTDQHASSLENLSDKKLRDLGLTDDEITIYRDLETQSKKTGKSIEELIEAASNRKSGRELLLESFVNIKDTLGSIFGSMKDAWESIFPPDSLYVRAERIYGVLEKFNSFTKNLKKSTQDTEDLRRTFEGLFAALDLVRMVVGGPITLAFRILKSICKAFDIDVLSITANIGDAIVAFRNWIKSNDVLTKGIKVLGDALMTGFNAIKKFVDKILELPKVQNAIESIKDIGTNIVDGLKNGLKDGVSSLPSMMIEIGKSIIEAIKNVLGIHSPSRVMFEIGGNIIDGLFNGLKDGISKLIEIGEFIGDKLSGIFKAIDWEKLFAIGITIGIIATLRKIGSALELLGAPLKGIGDVLENTSAVIEQFSDGINRMSKAASFKMKTEGIKNLAESLVMLVAAIVVLTYINPDNLWEAVGIVAALAGILFFLSLAMSKLNAASMSIDQDGFKMQSVGPKLLSIATSMLILAAAVKVIGSMGDGYKQGLLGLAALAGGLIVFLAMYGKLVKGKAAQNMDKLGKMLMKLSISLLLLVGVIKLIGMLSEDDLTNGAAFAIAFTGFVAALVFISKYAGKNTDKVAKLISKISLSMLLMVGVVKLIGMLSPTEMWKGLAFALGFSLFVGVLVAITRNGGRKVEGLGRLLMSVSISMLLMAGVVKVIGGMSLPDLIKGTAAVVIFGVIIITLIETIQAIGPQAPKLAATLLAMSVAIGILAAVAVMLSLIDPLGLAKGVIAVGFLSSFMAAMILATRGANDCKGNLIVMTVAIGIMTACIAALSFIDPTSLAGATIALSIVMGMFSLMTFVAGKAQSSIAPLIVMVSAVAVLAGVIYLLSGLDVNNALAASTAISELLIAMSVAMAAASLASTNALGAIVAVGAMTIVVGLLGGLLALFTLMDVDAAMTIATALSKLLLTMSVSLAILTVVGALAEFALAGVVAMIAMVVGVGTLVATIGGLVTAFPQLEEFINTGIPLLSAIGNAIGTFFGEIVGGFMSGMSSELPKVAEDLSTFIEKLQPFINSASKIDASSMEGVKSLAKTLLILTATELLDQLTSWFTGGTSLADFGEQLVPFGEKLAEFSDAVKDRIDSKAVEAAANAGKMMAEMAKTIPNSGGVVGFFAGENDIDTFGSKLPRFGRAIVKFSNIVKKGKIDSESIESAANAGKMMAEMASTIPNSGGVVGFFAGDNDMDTFAAQLQPFGDAIVDFSTTVKGNINEDAVNAAANAGKMMAEMASTLPNSGGAVAFFTGDNSMDDFGEQLVSFGESIVEFSKKVTGNINEDAVNAAANAGKMMAEMASTIPEDDNLWENIFGGGDGFESFCETLPKFGDAISAFSESLGENINTSAITSAATAGKTLAQMAEVLPEEGFPNLSSFNEQLPNFGDAMKKFSAQVEEVNVIQLNAHVNQFKSIVEKLKTVSSTGMNDFIKVYKDKSITALKTVGSTMKDIISILNGKKADFRDSGEAMAVALSDGLRAQDNLMKLTFIILIDAIIDAVKTKRQSFYDAGEYIVKGFASGIEETTYIAEAKAKAMANAAVNSAKKALDEHSPSKVFYGIGAFAGQGFVNALGDYENKAGKAGSNIANTATSGLSNAISKVRDIINDGIDDNVTIRPVLDLSNVSSGANAIQSLLNSNGGIGVNVGTINSMMNGRRQNGNSEVVSAINKLGNKIDNMSGDIYTINGITYDDGSNITDAVKTLVRAARVERRI